MMENNGFIFKQHITINKGIKSGLRTNNKLKMFPTTTEHLFFFYKGSHNIFKGIFTKKKNTDE